MRRLASVFQKRSDKSDAGASTDSSQAPPKSKKIHARLLNVSTERARFLPVNSSSSSSSGSASLQTPEDDANPDTLQDTPKKPVMSWLGRKKTGPSRRSDAPHIRDWASSHPVPVLCAPPVSNSGVDRQHAEDSEDATSSESSDDETPAIIERASFQVTSSTLNSSRTALLSIISSSLTPPFSPPPCLHPPSGPLFPRSCNLSRGLPFQDSAESCMHKSVLLRRLQLNNLSRSEALSISPFASQSARLPGSKTTTALSEAAVASKRIELFSEGLRRWACRPCFEDRMMVWEPTENSGGHLDISCKRVSGNGRGYGVASLEFSEGLEAMAGLLADEESPEGPITLLAVPYATEELQAPPSTASSTSSHASGYFQLSSKSALPSPLRIEEPSPSPIAIHLSLPASTSMPPSPSTAPTSPESPMPAYSNLSLDSPEPKARSGLPKPKGLSVEDVADHIPLGYALRIKKQREQKARFLQEERQRRMLEEKKKLEEERRKHDEERRKESDERRKQEEERQKWERERKAWEMEKRAMEEEKKQRKFKDEVVAARMRREEERSGARRVSVVESDKADQRTRRESSRQRPNRQASDSHLPLPPNSRPASVAETHHRPPSMYSAYGASTEDLRVKDRGRKSLRRQSTASDVESSPHTSMSPPTSWSMYGMPVVPPMPTMPMMVMSPYVPGPYVDNTPLLPPNAPFMSQNYGDKRSRSRSGSKPRGDSPQSSRSSSHSRPHSSRSNNSSDHVPRSSTSVRAVSDSHRGHERRPSAGESPSRLSVPQTNLASQGRSYSGSDVEHKYSSVRGPSSSSTLSAPSRPTIVSSASWGGPWAAQTTMSAMGPMPPYGGPGFVAAPMPMISPGMPRGRSSPSTQRQSVIF